MLATFPPIEFTYTISPENSWYSFFILFLFALILQVDGRKVWWNSLLLESKLTQIISYWSHSSHFISFLFCIFQWYLFSQLHLLSYFSWYHAILKSNTKFAKFSRTTFFELFKYTRHGLNLIIPQLLVNNFSKSFIDGEIW